MPVDVLPDGAALSAYQYFENIRNFLDAMQEMGLPSFAASDLEKVGVVAFGRREDISFRLSLIILKVYNVLVF